MRQRQQPGFAHGMRREAGPWRPCQQIHDVDDGTATAGEHGGRNRIGDIEGAVDRDARDPVPRVEIVRGHRCLAKVAGAVHQDVDAAPAVNDLPCHRLHGVGVRHVALDGQGFYPQRPRLGRRFLRSLCRPVVVDHYVRARLRQH